ncbi:MAG: PatB family C-S lyase [Candidatus Cloacimonetes bacterium]|nr:PatB family C-S lyase [Candidatus Cloacimonadota bacterium]
MKYDFDKIIDRKNTDCYKWDYLKEIFTTDDVLPLWVADLDFAPPPKILKAIENRAKHPIYGYTFHPQNYYSSFINWHKKRFDCNIDSDWIIHNPSIVTGFNLIIQNFTQRNDKILIFTPVYTPFYDAINLNERQLITSELQIRQKQYEIDFDDLEMKLKNDVKMILFCSPHNPIGRVWKKSELIKIVELCERYNVFLVSDEIHADIVFENKRNIPLVSFSTKLEKFISLHSPAKTFGISGITNSIAVIPNKILRTQFSDTLKKLHWESGNIFGLLAFEAAYSSDENWLEQLLEYLYENYLFVKNELLKKCPEIVSFNLEGTYLMWLDFRNFGLTQEKLIKKLVYEAKLGFSDGTIYGKDGTGFMRMNIACPRSILKKAVKQLVNNFK